MIRYALAAALPARRRARRSWPADPRVRGALWAGDSRRSYGMGDRLADVVVLTMSEFGRTVRQNGSQRHRPRARDGDVRARWRG